MERVRYGMVGGGSSTFIGAVHRAAASLDGELELVCGAFSGDAQRSRAVGETLRLDSERCYSDYETMFAREALRDPAERMRFVSVVTPNHLHFPVAVAALRRGFHVLSDKPATISLRECIELEAELSTRGLLYAIAHAYACYPLVAEAKNLVASGKLGTIRKVVVEYSKGSLAKPLERSGNARAQRRLDPARTGPSCCFGDIGVHAFNLAEFVTGLDVTEMAAELNHVIKGRTLDDDGTALLRFNNGGHGVLMASLVSIGEENNLALRVYGDEATLEWRQMEPNSLWLRYADRPAELLRAGSSYLCEASRALSRVSPGHPEGFIEAFANLYSRFAAQVREHEAGPPEPGAARHAKAPGIREALRGMAFVETAITASASSQKWHRFPDLPL